MRLTVTTGAFPGNGRAEIVREFQPAHNHIFDLTDNAPTKAERWPDGCSDACSDRQTDRYVDPSRIRSDVGHHVTRMDFTGNCDGAGPSGSGP